MEILIAIFLVVFVAAFASFIGAAVCILRGWVLAKLWAWFMVPAFGLPVLGIAPAIGIALTVSFLTHHSNPKGFEDVRTDKEKQRDNIAELVGLALTPLFFLFAGWIVKLFM